MTIAIKNLKHPVVIHDNLPKLKDSHRKLLQLIQHKLEKQEVLSYEDVKKFYIREVAGNNSYHVQRYNHDIGDFEWQLKKVYQLSKWQFDGNCKGWFAHTLGSLVVKGYLVAIPILNFKQID